MKRTSRKLLIIVLVVTILSSMLGVVINGMAAPAAAGQQAYNFKSVNTGAGGGFIVDVIFHPTQPNLIYAKTDMGGVYRWNQATGTWKQLMDWVTGENWNWTGGESVALDPSDPNKLYIAGGTYTNGWSPDNGVILRSSDQGNTFQVTQMSFKMGGNMPGRGMGERLAVDPNLGSILYFGARNGQGLWKSTNSGVSWSKVTNFPATGVYMEEPNDTTYDYGNHPVGIPWVIFDKSTGTAGSATQTIYVGVADGRSGQPHIYRSTNGGSTWAAVPGQPTCTLSGNIVTCPGGLTWDKSAVGDDGLPSSPKDNLLAKQAAFDSAGTMYVTYSNWAGPYRGNFGDVWKFVPSTGVWTRINPTTGNNACGFTTPYWGYGGLGVDMQNPGTLVVAAVNSWWPDGQLFRTTDGGATWKCIWNLTGWPTIVKQFSLNVSSAPWLALGNPTFAAPEASIKIGWMMEGLKIDPHNSNRMMYGTGATLYGTTNLSAWDTGGIVNISSMAVGMEETSVLGLVSPPTGTTRLFSAVGDVGGWKHTSLDTPPAMGYTIPDTGTVTTIDYAELSPAFLVRAGSKTAFTYDSGGSWFAGNNSPVTGQGYGTIAAASNASRVLWAANNSPVAWSSDNGNAWNTSVGVPSNTSANPITVASDRVNPSKFYAFGTGKFFYSTNGGANFTASTATGFPNSGKPKAVIGREGDVWVTGGEMISGGSTQCSPCGLWHTTDGGLTFSKLPNVDFAAAIGFGMAAPGGNGYPAIYLFGKVDGGMLTIYRSDDTGASWVRITDDQHNYATIQTITGDPTLYGRVYFGSNGLGIHYGDIAGGPQPTPTRTNTPGTPVITSTPTNTPVTPVITNTPTNTPVTPVITATRTRTSTTGPSPTRTRTSTTGPSPTRTSTAVITSTPTGPVPPTATRTSTPTTGPVITNTPTTPPTGGACSPVTSTITVPFTFDGAGQFCWQAASLGGFINSWNTTSVSVNGMNVTNIWVGSGSYPAKINNNYYVSYNSAVAWGHFEVRP